MDIGMIGLGAMGRAMASNLAAAGHRVSAWNRSRVTVEGVTVVADAAEVFRSDAVIPDRGIFDDEWFVGGRRLNSMVTVERSAGAEMRKVRRVIPGERPAG